MGSSRAVFSRVAFLIEAAFLVDAVFLVEVVWLGIAVGVRLSHFRPTASSTPPSSPLSSWPLDNFLALVFT